LKFSAKSQLRVTANRNKQFKTNTRKKLKNENKLQKKKYEYQSNFRVDVVEFGFIGILTKDEPGGLIMVGL
jgi:hypothetical protein